jgi:RNA polymerase sigma-70 factor (ECF subfamily)
LADPFHAPDEGAALLDPSIVAGLRGDAASRRHAVERLYAAFAGRLRRYFVHRRATPAQAEDFTQETFVRILRSAGEFRGEGAQFAAWIWTIARNVALDAGRRSASQPTTDIDALDADELPVQESADPLQHVESESVADCVQRGFGEFARRYPGRAQCLSWLATDRMDIAQVAAALGRSAAATREYLSQCRKKLRPFIEHCWAGG